jgi:hypothetical protein
LAQVTIAVHLLGGIVLQHVQQRHPRVSPTRQLGHCGQYAFSEL